MLGKLQQYARVSRFTRPAADLHRGSPTLSSDDDIDFPRPTRASKFSSDYAEDLGKWTLKLIYYKSILGRPLHCTAGPKL